MVANLTLPPATEGIEPGTYEVSLAKIESVEGQYGPQYKLYWDIEDLDNEQLSSYASQKMGPRTTLRTVVEALLGRELLTGEAAQSKDLLGKRCQVVIENNDKGYPRIVAYARIRKQKPGGQRALPTEPTDAPAGESTDPDEWDAPAS
jgi:hypothetical protein